MKQKTLRSRVLSGLLAAVILLTLAPGALAVETYYYCKYCKQQTAVLTIIKEANCHEEGVDEYICKNSKCDMYNKSQLEKVPFNSKNHDAVYRDNGDGTHSGVCTYRETHNTDVHIDNEKHTYNTSGVCIKCLSVDYSDVKLSLPETMEQFISLHDVNARLSVGDVSLTAGKADLTSEYTVSYNWYYKGELVGSGKTYAPPSDVIGAVGTYQYACFVMAVPKNNTSLQILSKTCTIHVRVEDLVTAYATVGSGEEYMDFGETNSRMPMSVEDQIYEAVYNVSNGEPDYVVFKEPPSSVVGSLNVLTDSRRYYFYSAAGGTNNRLSAVTFTPSGSGETGSYIVYFSVFDDKGKEFPGVLTILVEKYTGNMDVLYTAPRETAVALDEKSFEDFWMDSYPSGRLNRVNFTRLPAAEEGGLYIGWSDATHTGTRVKSGDYFYSEPRGGQYGLSEVSFVPASGFTGYVVLPFEAYGENNRGSKTPRNGNMYVFISDGTVSDVTCRIQPRSTYPLSEAEFLSVYQAAGGAGSNFYIQLLDVPASGSLYLGYTSAGRGTRLTASTIKDRPFYYANNWGDLISDLTYVPGMAQSESVRYVAYDGQGRPLYAGNIRFTLLEEVVISYTADSSGVRFQAKDFTQLPGAAGKTSSVTFTPPASAVYGTLYYGRTTQSAGTAITSESLRYYLTAPEGALNVLLLENISFVPAQGFAGTVSIPFTAFDATNGKMSGTVKIEVPSTPSTPITPTDPTNPDTPSKPDTPSISFSDMPQNESTAWYYDAVIDLATAGVIGGFEDGTFRPSDPVTYSQALKMIMKAAGYEDIAPTGTHWASGYLDKAVSDGLIKAAASQLDKRIDRYTIAEVAAKSLGLNQPAGSVSPFADMEMTDSKAPYVLALYEKDIIKGSTNAEDKLIYNGAYAIRRSEMAVIIWRMYNFKTTGMAEPQP